MINNLPSLPSLFVVHSTEKGFKQICSSPELATIQGVGQVAALAWLPRQSQVAEIALTRTELPMCKLTVI
jgi:hypothetical protein